MKLRTSSLISKEKSCWMKRESSMAHRDGGWCSWDLSVWASGETSSGPGMEAFLETLKARASSLGESL